MWKNNQCRNIYLKWRAFGVWKLNDTRAILITYNHYFHHEFFLAAFTQKFLHVKQSAFCLNSRERKKKWGNNKQRYKNDDEKKNGSYAREKKKCLTKKVAASFFRVSAAVSDEMEKIKKKLFDTIFIHIHKQSVAMKDEIWGMLLKFQEKDTQRRKTWKRKKGTVGDHEIMVFSDC